MLRPHKDSLDATKSAQSPGNAPGRGHELDRQRLPAQSVPLPLPGSGQSCQGGLLPALVAQRCPHAMDAERGSPVLHPDLLCLGRQLVGPRVTPSLGAGRI